jgi:hypothetical protein
MTSVSRDDFLSRRDEFRRIEAVPLPEFGDDSVIKVQGLDAASRFKWALARDKAIEGDSGAAEPTSLLVALSAVDDNGKRLFKDEDAEYISQHLAEIVDRIATKASELSGLSDKAAEDAEGNSAATESGDSPSS